MKMTASIWGQKDAFVCISVCCELNCVSPRRCVEVLTPVPVNVALFGNKFFANRVKLRRSHTEWGWPWSCDCCPYVRKGRETEETRAEAMCGQRKNLERRVYKPRATRDHHQHQNLEEAGGILPWSLQTLWFSTSGLQNIEEINSYCSCHPACGTLLQWP